MKIQQDYIPIDKHCLYELVNNKDLRKLKLEKLCLK
jgi:hypothetical protein